MNVFLQKAGRWLGNTTNTAEHPTFRTRTYEATRYDDISHRIDAFTTLKLAEPFETSIGTTVKNLPLGFGVTTDGRRQTIEDKLTRQYNNSAQLPFGFSQIDYYTNGALKTSLAMRLSEAARQGKMDAHRTVMTHNKSVEIPD